MLKPTLFITAALASAMPAFAQRATSVPSDDNNSFPVYCVGEGRAVLGSDAAWHFICDAIVTEDEEAVFRKQKDFTIPSDGIFVEYNRAVRGQMHDIDIVVACDEALCVSSGFLDTLGTEGDKEYYIVADCRRHEPDADSGIAKPVQRDKQIESGCLGVVYDFVADVDELAGVVRMDGEPQLKRLPIDLLAQPETTPIRLNRRNLSTPTGVAL